MRQAERDRVQAGQRGPDQVVEAAGVRGGQHDGLAGSHQLADHAAVQVGGAAAQPGRQPVQADQAQPVAVDEHEPARVGPGQLAQAGRDPVQHRLQLELGVHVRDDVAEAAHHAGPLGHVVPGRVVPAGGVAHVHPAGQPAAVQQRAGVDTQVEHAAVLADPPGGERDLAAVADPLEHRVVLGLELGRDDRRRLAEDLGGGPAEDPLGRRVPGHRGPVGAEGHDRVGRRGQHRPRGRAARGWSATSGSQAHGLIIASPAGGRAALTRPRAAPGGYSRR